MKLTELKFNDLYGRCVIIKNDKALSAATDMMKDYSYTVAPNWDAVLCYCYIDSMAGMSFHFLCFAEFGTSEVDFACYEKLLSERIVLMYRYNDEYEATTYIKDTDGFSERIKMVNDGYHRNERVLPTRNIRQIDHLRYSSHPDDIQVILRKSGLQIEQVWVRLTGIENGNLEGTLLNEPNADFGVHSGNIVQVQVTQRGNDIYAVCLIP